MHGQSGGVPGGTGAILTVCSLSPSVSFRLHGRYQPGALPRVEPHYNVVVSTLEVVLARQKKSLDMILALTLSSHVAWAWWVLGPGDLLFPHCKMRIRIPIGPEQLWGFKTTGTWHLV